MTVSSNHIHASGPRIPCDYEEAPLLPGEAIELCNNLEYLNIDDTTLINFDIYVIRIST